MNLPLRVLSDDEHENQRSDKAKRVSYRYPAYQTSKLEEIFQELKHPNAEKICEIAKEIGLEQNQVKYWFQNQRTKLKNKNENTVNSTIRDENEKISKENLELKEQLKSIVCKSCRRPLCKYNVEPEDCLKHIRLENVRLKEEYERVSKFVARHMKKQNPSLELNIAIPTKSTHGDILNLVVGESASLNLGIGSSSKSILASDENAFPQEPRNIRAEMERAMMIEAAIDAKEELLKLFHYNEPLWIKSQIDGRLVLHRENYEDAFPRVDHLNGAKPHVESSKDSRMVMIKAMDLVEMLLDSEKWTNLFPTIVSKAEPIKVVEKGSSENRSGALLLMHEEIHVLSPLVPSREFYFLRYCVQVEADIWVIVDVSYDYLKDEGTHSSTWKFPSGCLIQKISSVASRVSWIEHVEVDAKKQMHCMYKDIVNNGVAFGAERWLMELQRMDERFSRVTLGCIPSYGVVTFPEGRRSVMQLSHRVVKDFNKILAMPSMFELPQCFIDTNDRGVRFAIRKNTNLSLSNEKFIVIGASSILLPLPSHDLFEFLRDPARRFEWDIICHGNPWHEIAHISTGTRPNSYVSIIKPLDPALSDGAVIIQECFMDALESYIVYSPISIPEMNTVINNHDSSIVKILPSGFFISENSQSLLDDRNIPSTSNVTGGVKKIGSLLTMAFQLYMPGPEIVNLESAVDASNKLITTTVESIKHAFLSYFDSQ